METTSNESGRAHARNIRGAAREAAQQTGEDLIDRVGDAADPEVRRLRSKVAAAIATTKTSIADGAERVQRQAKEAFEAGDHYVRNQPWEAIGIAALADLAVGFLVARS